MKKLLLTAGIIQLISCGSGSSGNTANAGNDNTNIAPPSGFSATFDRAHSVTLDWDSKSGISYDVYASSNENFDVENYSAYENSSLKLNAVTPYVFNIDQPTESYTFKIVARDDNAESSPAITSVYTRFSIPNEDSSMYYDAHQNLYVKRCSEGQQYDYLAEDCIGTAIRYTPSELSMHLTSIDRQWRLPTTEELDGLSVCRNSGERPTCVPQELSSLILDLFLGSGVASYYDITAIQPYFQDGMRWHRVHSFPTGSRFGSVNFGTNPNMHAVLVKTK